MAVNWALGLQQGPNPAELFQQGIELGRQRARENQLMEFRREQLRREGEVQESQVRAGKHIAAGDLPGARAEAAQSGNLDLVSAVNRMTADQRAEAAAQSQTLAPVYNRLRQLPYEQRRAELQRIAPALAARGIPAEIIGSYDPTDQNLDSDIALGQTLEQQLDQQRIHWQVIPQVGAFATDSMGRPTTPGQPGAQMPQAQPPAAAPQAAPAAGGDYAAGVGAALAQGGLPAPVVAGILGNGHHESGGQWNAAVGDNGTALGAFQWRNERADNFRRVIGTDPRQATPQQTAQFVLWEFQNPEQAGMTREQVQAIMNAGSEDEAARLFSRYYERPNARLAHDDRRVELARQYAGQGGGQLAGQQTAQRGPTPSPGQGRSIQDQAATGVIQAPPRVPEGMDVLPDGSLRPRAGSQQEFERGRARETDARESRREADQTLENFNDDPEVRQFRQARIATMQIRNLGTSGTPSDDVALIFSFMRALDPNSTVREGEFATAQNTAGIPDRLRNMYNQARQGTLLSPRQRQEFIGTANRLYVDRARSYNEIANSYRQRLRNMGVPEERIGPLIPTAEAPNRQDRQREQARASGRAAAGVGAGTTRTGGVRWRRVN